MDSSLVNATTAYTPRYGRRNAPAFEQLIVGLIYLCSSVFFLFFQFSLLIVIFRHRQLHNHLCYLLIAAISLVDLIQLLVHAYGGIIAICNNDFLLTLDIFSGGLVTCLANVGFGFELLLALDRLLVFLPRRLLSLRMERRVFGALVCICLLTNLFPYMPIMMSEHSRVAFRRYNWDFAQYELNEDQIWDWVRIVTTIIPVPIFIATFVLYMFIVVILFMQRNTMSQAAIQACNRQQGQGRQCQRWLAPHERRLLCLAFLQFGVECSLCLLWFYEMVTKGGMVLPGVYGLVFIEWHWLFFNGFKPLLYLAVNRSIRNCLLQLWRCRSINDNLLSIPGNNNIAFMKVTPVSMEMVSNRWNRNAAGDGNESGVGCSTFIKCSPHGHQQRYKQSQQLSVVPISA